MPLRGPRFSGDPILEECLSEKHRMHAEEQGLSVMRVQAALIELGHSVGPGGADGIFGTETGNAVSTYKTEKGLSPTDPVVGPGTMKALDDDLFFEPPDLDPLFGQFSLWVASRQLDPFIGQELARMLSAPPGSWRQMLANSALTDLNSGRLLGIVARSRRKDLKTPLEGVADPVQEGVPVGTWFDKLNEEDSAGFTGEFTFPDGSRGGFITVTDNLILGREAITRKRTGEKVRLTLPGVIGHELTHLRNLENENDLLQVADTDTSVYVDTALAQARSATGTPTSHVLQKFVSEMCARHVHWVVVHETAGGAPAGLAVDSFTSALVLHFANASDKFDLNKYIDGINKQRDAARFPQLDLWLRRCQAFSFSDDPAEEARTQTLFGDSAAFCARLAAEPSFEFPVDDGLFPLPNDFTS